MTASHRQVLLRPAHHRPGISSHPAVGRKVMRSRKISLRSTAPAMTFPTCVSTRASLVQAQHPGAAASSGRCREESDDRLPSGRPVDRHLHPPGQACRRAGVSLKGPPAVRSVGSGRRKLVYRPSPSRPMPTTATRATRMSPRLPRNCKSLRRARRAAAEAADEATADAPALEVAESFDPQGPVPAWSSLIACDRRHDSRMRDRSSSAGVLHDHHSRPIGHAKTIHGRNADLPSRPSRPPSRVVEATLNSTQCRAQ